MTGSRSSRIVRIVLAVALVAALGAVLAGCKSTSKTPSGKLTAKQALPVAMSALSTSAPDGKMLIVQTADPINTTSTPVWDFLIGSPKSDKIYAVVVKDGKATASEYGTAKLSADEWKAVPGSDVWKIDSDEAYTKAIKAYPDGKPDTLYLMGFVAYVPKASSASTVKAMTWNVSFDPSTMSKATTSSVNVNATTGEVSIPK